MKKISQIAFTIAVLLLLVGCKNTKQKLQQYVTDYNKTAVHFKNEPVTLTTARGYVNDNKIELRFETNLAQNEVNKAAAMIAFPKLLVEMMEKDQIPKELVTEGVQFDAYFLADDNTVLVKQIINKEEMTDLLKK
jgi:PBP1b-binding outer membrane lipoprotein LpoB